ARPARSRRRLRPVIVATAGHIDHGKTVLVKALTGAETDRLPEEKRRGMSIDLGFAYQTLDDDTVLGFVDVPGHERFIRNMLAGVTGIDFALLVVAADDGPMPQTREHLAILDLLGVSAGAVALTKIDRVDAARVDRAAAETSELLRETTLSQAPIFPVSGVTGDGVDALGAHLQAEAMRWGDRRAGGHFRLAVDRSFTLPGAGHVVTGTVFSGRVNVGDQLVLTPPGARVRVRSLHVQNRSAPAGGAGDRCAVNIVGTSLRKVDAHRGDWLLDEAVNAPTARIDASIRVLASEARALKHWTPVHVHCGAGNVTGRVAVLGERAIAPGGSGLVQIVLDREIGALGGDRLILRDQSARRTVGGGRVLDPFAPKRGRARPERLAALRALTVDDPATALASLLAVSPEGVDLAQFARAWNLTPEAADALWTEVPMARIGPDERPFGLTEARLTSLREMMVQALADWHQEFPAAPGAASEALRRALPERLSRPVFDALVADLLASGEIMESGGALRQPAFRPHMAPADAKLWDRIAPLIEAGGLRPPIVRELAAEIDLGHEAVERFLVRTTRLGLVVRVTANRFFPPDAVLALADAAEKAAAGSPDGQFSAAAFRDQTGIGRNLTIEVLEYFDRVGFTWRDGNARAIRRPARDILTNRAA
ncbi:MAG: selenocysteine-specific translation elongation factor, partial [Methyloligellaceae bacterium]